MDTIADCTASLIIRAARPNSIYYCNFSQTLLQASVGPSCARAQHGRERSERPVGSGRPAAALPLHVSPRPPRTCPTSVPSANRSPTGPQDLTPATLRALSATHAPSSALARPLPLPAQAPFVCSLPCPRRRPVPPGREPYKVSRASPAARRLIRLSRAIFVLLPPPSRPSSAHPSVPFPRQAAIA